MYFQILAFFKLAFNQIKIKSIQIIFKKSFTTYQSQLALRQGYHKTTQHKMQAQQVSNTNENQVQSLKVFFHLISQDQKNLESHLVDVEKTLTLEECVTILSDQLKKVINNPQFKLTPDSEPLNVHTPIDKLFQKDDGEVIIFYEDIKPVVKEKQKEVHFETLNKYSFYEEGKFVKVQVPLEGIGQHPDNKIHSRFLDRSFQIKIFDFKGKNWIFAVPKTQCQILVRESKIIKKSDKIIVKIGKIAQNDNWFSLHKTRMVGEKELD